MWIESTASGKYKACERYTDPISGKTKKATVTLDRDTKAARKAAQELLRAKIAEKLSVTDSDSITLGYLSDRYLEYQQKNIKPGSYISATQHIGHVCDLLGRDSLVNRLTARYVSEALSKGNNTDYQTNRDILYFKAMISWGYRHDYVESREWLDKIERIKIKKDQAKIDTKYLEPEELNALLSAMKSEKWKLLTEFLALTGMRVGEAIALLDSDVEHDVIHVTKTYSQQIDGVHGTPKTLSSIRDIHIQPELSKCIRKIRSYRRRIQLRTGKVSPYFLPNHDGIGMVSYDVYNHYVRDYSTKIGHRINVHALRHTHVSILAEQGVPLEVISRRLGHKDSAITRDIYLHVTSKRRAIDDAYIDGVKIL